MTQTALYGMLIVTACFIIYFSIRLIIIAIQEKKEAKKNE
jgi:hypothetical protein